MATHTRRRSVLVATTVAGALALTATALSGAAQAATGGKWTELSSGPGLSISSQPGVARFGANLLVAWPQADSSTTTALRTRVVGPKALPIGPVSNVLSWSSVSSDPALFLLGGTPTIAFGGLRSLDTTDPYTGPMAYVQSADGVSWAQGAGSLSNSRLAYGDYGIGAVDDGSGTPLVAFAAGSTDRVTVHHGIDPAVPAAAPDTYGTATGEAQGVSLARDRSTNTGWALWYSSVSGTNNGIHAEQVWPTTAGHQQAPLSSVLYAGDPTSVNPGQNVAVASRLGGGVWAAYGSGYPSPHRLVLWQVGTTKRLVLTRAGSIQYVGISPAPGGRMWVWWVEGGSVFAARTNPSVTTVGLVRRVTAPGGASPTRTAGDGSLGPLDVVINAQPGSSSALWTTRILEGLRVTVSRRKVATGHGLTVRVTDAGVAVKGARVRVGKVTKKTRSNGKVSFVIPRSTSKGKHTVSASAGGYVSGRAVFRVR
ncbi:MAG: hypothetical protein ACXV4A_02570 [Actinomycetes bacterium]